ncbi:hypothetical protein KI387_025791, partial [Taxus chinensis]
MDHRDQLDALLPDINVLAPGSLVIVTSRELGILQSWGISCNYHMPQLNPSHAQHIFWWHAFLEPFPPVWFESLVENFLMASNGLPLSLKSTEQILNIIKKTSQERMLIWGITNPKCGSVPVKKHILKLIGNSRIKSRRLNSSLGLQILHMDGNEFTEELPQYQKTLCGFAGVIAGGISGRSSIVWSVAEVPDLGFGDSMINTCNGFYCDSFEPNSIKKPKMWTENWSGWFLTFGGRVSRRAIEDVAFAIARTMEEQTLAGQQEAHSFPLAMTMMHLLMDMPKRGHLKELHQALKKNEVALTNGDINSISLGHDLEEKIYSLNTSGTCASFLNNAHPRKDATVQFNGKSYYLPAWSVSILPDCENVVFKTARVSTQTSSMGMDKVSLESLLPIETSTKNTKPFVKWLWHKELIGIWGGEHFSGNGLLEQLYTAKNKSDFMWYTNSVHIDEDEPLSKNKMQVYLHVETRGHALHVFVDGKFAGRQQLHCYYTFLGYYVLYYLLTGLGLQTTDVVCSTGSYNNTSFTMHLPITLKVGTNEIALLGVTIGWQTEFTAPKGDNVVALDLSTMSKGQAWVNGHHIGHYFPSFKAPTDGCSDSCDYRGTYSPANYATNCGKPSQE